MPELRLVYFKMRALAEAAQLVLAATDTPYTYEMAWDYFGEPWRKFFGLSTGGDRMRVQTGQGT